MGVDLGVDLGAGYWVWVTGCRLLGVGVDVGAGVGVDLT